MSRPAVALKRMVESLDRLGIGDCVVGSVASSVYGTPRTTMDIDMVTDIRQDQLPALAAELQGAFYADVDMMQDSWKHGRAFNVIHFASSHKIGIFPLSGDEYSQEAFGRRVPGTQDGPGLPYAIATAEDTILNKLRWYRSGGENSEVQWNDLRGMLRVTGSRVDREYLSRWAPQIGVADLLERLLNE
ncbi:MAG: hypothetical protein LAP40_21455 [Acidobacteriia bacterium]|nr:hypothetical protein [Terriglobia bacterium]